MHISLQIAHKKILERIFFSACLLSSFLLSALPRKTKLKNHLNIFFYENVLFDTIKCALWSVPQNGKKLKLMILICNANF
jgi:hypothetical protein